jgi:hypothetical protein
MRAEEKNGPDDEQDAQKKESKADEEDEVEIP